MRKVNTQEPLSRADFLFLRDRNRLPQSYLIDEDDDFTDAERQYASRAVGLAKQRGPQKDPSQFTKSQDVTTPPDETEEEEIEDYADLKVSELKDEANARGLEIPSDAKKSDLIALLEEDDEEEDNS